MLKSIAGQKRNNIREKDDRLPDDGRLIDGRWLLDACDIRSL